MIYMIHTLTDTRDWSNTNTPESILDKNFDEWLNDFCIYNFHYSYAALASLSKVDGRIVKELVTAIQEYFDKSPMGR